MPHRNSWIGGWAGPRAGLDTVKRGEKKPALDRNPTLVVQPVA